MSKYTRDSYTIGWVCALRDELAAALAMIDEPHPQLSKPRGDENTYTHGRIGKHNVVIACLPSGEYGKVSAAIVATSLVSSYPSLRYGLMVGIGGGAPSLQNDIRLGDIIVSKPEPDHGGVIQYDHGKAMEGGIFKRTGTLNRPPIGLLTALTSVQARHRCSQHGYLQYLERSRPGLDPSFTRPKQDAQFREDYIHEGDELSCKGCDNTKLKSLPKLNPPIPKVYYGIIASGDTLMRDAKKRDAIARQSGALCFEMEAAGLMHKFPCIVIRGICDYSDSHKNKDWQPYAAMAAAAYARELIDELAPEDVMQETQTVAAIQSEESIADPVSRLPAGLGASTYPHATASRSEQVSDSYSEPRSDFYSILDRKILASEGIALGRLVLNIDTPWEEYCPFTAKPRDDQISITLQFQFRDILSNASSIGKRDNFTNRLTMILGTDNPMQVLDSISEKTYILPNSVTWFENACADPKIRRWLERAVKFDRPVFLVVGIHTLSSSPGSIEEVIAAVQYRKVIWGWWWGSEIDAARLERDNHIWSPVLISRGGGDEKEEDLEVDRQVELLDMHLADDAYAEDLSDRETLYLNGTRFVF